MSKIDKNKSPNQNEAKDKDKGKNEAWLMLMMLINSLTCFYLVYPTSPFMFNHELISNPVVSNTVKYFYPHLI